jgi:hypothetical protein
MPGAARGASNAMVSETMAAAARWRNHALTQGSRAIRAGQKRQRRSRQRGDAVDRELVAAFRREEPPGTGRRDVRYAVSALAPAARRAPSPSQIR